MMAHVSAYIESDFHHPVLLLAVEGSITHSASPHSIPFVDSSFKMDTDTNYFNVGHYSFENANNFCFLLIFSPRHNQV